jgi:hypothetical protein
MKAFKIILIAMILFILPRYSHSSDLAIFRTSLIEGDVQLKTGQISEWVPASVNMPLKDGDMLWIPEEGKLEIQLNEGSFLRLDENSSIDINASDRDSFHFYLTQGHAYINFKGVNNHAIKIDTPVSSVYAYDRSTFRIDLSRHGYQEVSVLNGLVYVEERSGKTRVTAGKTLSLKGDNYADISLLGPPDAWERWNRHRDTRLEGLRYSYSYLPEELKIYSYDFDENGKWVFTSDFGYVWTPTINVSPGWAPYRLGRWTWIGGDYVWVSYESWGWAPYHYGRWTFNSSIGWFWVPPARAAVYWGPGFVGWVHTPAYVAWIPLAPREIYYGYGYYGPRSVNIININVHKTVIKNVYRNVYIDDAVTVVHADTFISGRHVNFRMKKNPFLKRKVNIGRPAKRPGRASFIPIIKKVPHLKQPPRHIKNMPSRKSRKLRTFINKQPAPYGRYYPFQKIKPIGNGKNTISRKTRTLRNKKAETWLKIQPTRKSQKRRFETIENHSQQKMISRQPKRSSELRYSAAQKLSKSPGKIRRRSNSHQSTGYSTNRVKKERKAHVSVNKKSGRINRAKKR